MDNEGSAAQWTVPIAACFLKRHSLETQNGKKFVRSFFLKDFVL
jgi:hypothetical protein